VEPQRTAELWSLPTVLLPLNKQRLLPCPLHLHDIAVLEANQEICRSAELHDVFLSNAYRDASLLRIHVLDGSRYGAIVCQGQGHCHT
jgi:hypothetical protein